jgi:hypothetical protein
MRDATWVRHPLWYRLALEDAFRSLRPGSHRAPLLGFSKIAPPSTWAARVNSDVGSGMGVGHLWAHASDRPCRGPVAFHLHGFSPSWWFAPRAVLRVCCTPLPILGFAEFRAAWPVPRGSGSGPSSSAHEPFEAFPLPVAVPLSRAPAFLPFAFRIAPVGSTSRLCSTGQVRRGRRCCHRLSLVASLGFASTWQGGSFGSSEDLRHSLEQSRRGSSSCPTPPCPGTPCGVSWLGLRAFEGLSARAGRWVRLPLLVAEATKGVRSGRFIRASFPLRSGCEHPLRIGTGRGPKPSPVAGDHDASGTRPR